MVGDSRPFVVVGGTIHPDGLNVLQAEARVTVTEDPTEDAMIELAAEADGILFRIRPFCTERVMAACRKLRVVGRHGVGLDTIDIPAATRLGIAVVHAPASNSQAVAEHAVMLMLNCVKRTRVIDRSTRAGEWSLTRFAGISELAGKTLGIVGVGDIGQLVAKICGQGFAMTVLGYDPYVPDEELRRRGAEPVKSLDDLLSRADIVTCHTPLTPETRAMINARTLALMKPGAVFINTSRGPVQDERALFEALARGRLGAAGLDVFEQEPSSADNPLFGLDNVVCTSHVAGVSGEAQRNMGVQVASEMVRVLRGELPKKLVNPEVGPRLRLR